MSGAGPPAGLGGQSVGMGYARCLGFWGAYQLPLGAHSGAHVVGCWAGSLPRAPTVLRKMVTVVLFVSKTDPETTHFYVPPQGQVDALLSVSLTSGDGVS